MKNFKPLVPLFVITISLALLIPGVTQPMLTLTGTIDKAQITETGVDLIIDSVVGNSLKKDKRKTEETERNRIRKMISTVLGMFGLKNITGEIEAYKQTRSILGTVEELFRSGNGFVAFLVMLFSIVIPVTKMLLLLLGTYFRELKISKKAILINGLISKWSMADVFLIAIIVSFMAANASTMGELLNLQAQFEVGFYFFLGYCIFSIISTQLITWYYKTFIDCPELARE